MTIKSIWTPSEVFGADASKTSQIVEIRRGYMAVYNSGRTTFIAKGNAIVHWSDPERLTRDELFQGPPVSEYVFLDGVKVLQLGVDGIVYIEPHTFTDGEVYVYVLTKDWQVERYDYTP